MCSNFQTCVVILVKHVQSFSLGICCTFQTCLVIFVGQKSFSRKSGNGVDTEKSGIGVVSGIGLIPDGGQERGRDHGRVHQQPTSSHIRWACVVILVGHL